MVRVGLLIEGASIAHHHVVRRRDDNRVVAEFPHGAAGAVLAAVDAHRRNKSPDSSHPPYLTDTLRENELFYDKNGILRRHVHEEH
jgi:hypothetical protein